MDKERLVKDALFADETVQFRFPVDVKAGDEVTFRFRTLKDSCEKVVLMGRSIRSTMEKKYSKGCFDFFETTLTARKEPLLYFFEVHLESGVCFYNKLGVSEYHSPNEYKYCFRMIPGFSVPAWARGNVMYQIFVDRFRNGDRNNDPVNGEYLYTERSVEPVEDWNSLPSAYDVHRHFGGDLPGVYEKLDYLKNLGVETIYFNPLFVSPSNHKYDTQDYDHIDPHFVGFPFDEGNVLPKDSDQNRESERYINRVTDLRNLENANRYFAFLSEEIHKRGMRLIIDGVFNHCGSFNKWMDAEYLYYGRKGYENGAFIDENSPYRDYFTFEKGSKWPNNESYVGWWGHSTLPKLDYENSKELHDYVMGIAKKWLGEPYKIDGWRLDVAADIGQTETYNHEFWRDFRKAVKEEKEDALILAEHYGDPESWLRGDQWDTVMNYDAFMEPVSYFLTGMEKHSDSYNGYLHGNAGMFLRTMAEKMSSLPEQSLYTAMNELSNHDHSRFMTRTNSRVGRLATAGSDAAGEGVSRAVFYEGVVMQFTLPGAPTLYYGDETGVVGWTDPDSRRTYPWGREDYMLIGFHKDMIRIHKKYSCFKTGSYIPLYGEHEILSYARFDDNNIGITVINHAGSTQYAEIPVWLSGAPENGSALRVMQTGHGGYNVGLKTFEIREGYLRMEIPPETAMVFVLQNKSLRNRVEK